MASRVEQAVDKRVEQAIEKLKMTGVRMTPQRHAILAYLLQTDTHPTVDEIYRALEDRFPNMSVATVYNNLKVFLEAGLVRELAYGDGANPLMMPICRSIITPYVKNAAKSSILNTRHCMILRKRPRKVRNLPCTGIAWKYTAYAKNVSKWNCP